MLQELTDDEGVVTVNKFNDRIFSLLAQLFTLIDKNRRYELVLPDKNMVAVIFQSIVILPWKI